MIGVAFDCNEIIERGLFFLWFSSSVTVLLISMKLPDAISSVLLVDFFFKTTESSLRFCRVLVIGTSRFIEAV